jgi:hypothetical protein
MRGGRKPFWTSFDNPPRPFPSPSADIRNQMVSQARYEFNWEPIFLQDFAIESTL